MTTPQDILDFWLNLDPKAHFTKDDEFDAELTERFGQALTEARNGAYDNWACTADGALALIILLDQFPRNIYRGTPDMFASDAKALAAAKMAIGKKFDEGFPAAHRTWFYMPFMHAEDLADQVHCIVLCHSAGLDNNVSFAIDHADIIRKFGRFPHRNKIVGRTSSREEEEYLDDGGFSG